MNLKIRQMNKEDIENVQDVARKSWHATYKGIIPHKIQENFLATAYSDKMMDKRLNHSLLLVAEEEKIVGFANFSPINDADEAELLALYIYPEHQEKGIGTALLREGIHLLDGVRRIYTNVEKENEVGKTFYLAKGFKEVEEFDDDFDGHILKTLRMVSILDNWN